MLKAAHRVRVVLTVLAVATATLLAGPLSVALAHADLASSTPRDGESLASVPGTVGLTFTDTIAAQFVRVSVTDPSGTGTVAATTKGTVVTVPIQARGPGSYRVAYRVVSADGHPVSGAVAFTVTGAGSAQVPPSGSGGVAAGSEAPRPASAGVDDPDGGAAPLLYVVVAVVALAAVTGLVLAVRGGRRR